MPRIRWMARAVGIAIVLMTTAGDGRAQGPRGKAAPPAQDQEGDDEAMPARPAKPAGRADAKAAPGNGRPGANRGGAPGGNGPPDGTADENGNPGRGGGGGGGGGRGGPGGGRNGSNLDRLRDTLINPSSSVAATLLPLAPIQKELNLTDKQKAAIQKVIQGMGQQNRVLGQQRRELMMAARMNGIMMPDTSELQLQEANLQQENAAAFAAILSKPEQRRRLNQIANQILGPLAVAKPDVAEKLNLAPGQIEDIAAIIMQRQASQDQLRNERRMAGFMGRDPNGDPASRDLGASKASSLEEKAKKLQTDTNSKIGRVLNKKQRADYLKLLGEPFDLSLLEDQRSGGPRGSGGPGNGPGGFGNGPGGFGGPGTGEGPPPGGNGRMPRDRAAAAKGAPRAAEVDAEADADPADAPAPKPDRPRGPSRKGAGARAAKPAADPDN